MRSLYVRLLLAFWITLAAIAGLSAVIHAWAFPTGWSPRQDVMARTIRLRAGEATACLAEGPRARCDALLEPIDRRDQRIGVYGDGVLLVGAERPEGLAFARDVEQATAASTRDLASDEQLMAVPLGRGQVAVAAYPRPSRWFLFFLPDTLWFRIAAIVAVTGLVSVFLARYLSRPVRTLRAATQKLGAGDLSVRVSPDLVGADSETLALGQELDRMAERIQGLLDAQQRLLRDVSHELRSPLARLQLALELVRRKTGPDVEPALDRIGREADRLAEMIGELLTLSRLESGLAIERGDDVDLGELLESVADDVAFEAEQRGARVELAQVDSVTLRGNGELLRRAIENVMRNAVRFTEQGTAVEVRLGHEGGEARLEVRDRGPGVPDDALADIFQPFYRVAGDRARRSGGVGIGLAITHGAVVAHGGHVRAENAPGGGLSVRLTLPTSAAEEPAPVT